MGGAYCSPAPSETVGGGTVSPAPLELSGRGSVQPRPLRSRAEFCPFIGLVGGGGAWPVMDPPTVGGACFGPRGGAGGKKGQDGQHRDGSTSQLPPPIHPSAPHLIPVPPISSPCPPPHNSSSSFELENGRRLSAAPPPPPPHPWGPSTSPPRPPTSLGPPPLLHQPLPPPRTPTHPYRVVPMATKPGSHGIPWQHGN